MEYNNIVVVSNETIGAISATIVLANDIIYVEPRYRFTKTIVAEIAPLVSLLTTTILLYTIFVKK